MDYINNASILLKKYGFGDSDYFHVVECFNFSDYLPGDKLNKKQMQELAVRNDVDVKIEMF